MIRSQPTAELDAMLKSIPGCTYSIVHVMQTRTLYTWVVKVRSTSAASHGLCFRLVWEGSLSVNVVSRWKQNSALSFALQSLAEMHDTALPPASASLQKLGC